MPTSRTPRPNISDQELDRDLINLFLPEIDFIATHEECAALYAPGVYQQLLASLQTPVPPTDSSTEPTAH